MSWVKIDDQFPDHPKVVAAGPLASWMYVCGLSYCARFLTDGFIPAAQIRRLADVDGATQLAETLVRVGLWEHAEGGYQVHDYLEYQPSKEKALATKEARAEAGAKGGVKSGESRREANPKQNASTFGSTNAKQNRTPSPYPSHTPININSNVEGTGKERESVSQDSSAVAGATDGRNAGKPSKAVTITPPGYTKQVWSLLRDTFGALTWGNSGFARETKAVEAVLKGEPRASPQDIHDFLVYKASCEAEWKSDVLEMPLLSNVKKDFGGWYKGGRPKGVIQNGKGHPAYTGTAKSRQSEASIREEMEYRAGRQASGDYHEGSLGI